MRDLPNFSLDRKLTLHNEGVTMAIRKFPNSITGFNPDGTPIVDEERRIKSSLKSLTIEFNEMSKEVQERIDAAFREAAEEREKQSS